MADVYWVGRQKTRAQVGTLTVTTASTGGTITVTVGGVRTVVVTPSTTNTTTTAAEIAAACAASAEGEFKEITWTSAANVVTFTGPADGRPVTVTKADGGSNATTLAAAATPPLSPNDAADGANYSTNALPTGGSRLVLQGDTPDLLWNLAGLTNAITFLRTADHTGRVGLPDVSDNGYPEYRPTALELNATAIAVELADTDTAQQLRLKGTSASACTATVTGPGSSAQPGREVVELSGLVLTSAVRVVGGSLAICPALGQTATVASVSGVSSVLTLGAGTTLTGGTLFGCSAVVDCSWSGTLTADGQSSVVVGQAAAAGTGLAVQGGARVQWRSSGALGAVVLQTGGVLDLAAAPAPVAVTSVARHAGATLLNPFDRVTRPYTVTQPDTDAGDGRLVIGVGQSVTVN